MGDAAAGLLFTLCVYVAAGATSGAWRHRRLRAIPRCAQCKYDLDGLPETAPCPECGSVQKFTVVVDRWWTYSWRNAATFMAIALVWPLILICIPPAWFALCLIEGWSQTQATHMTFRTLETSSVLNTSAWLVWRAAALAIFLALGAWASMRHGPRQGRRLLSTSIGVLAAIEIVQFAWAWFGNATHWPRYPQFPLDVFVMFGVAVAFAIREGMYPLGDVDQSGRGQRDEPVAGGASTQTPPDSPAR